MFCIIGSSKCIQQQSNANLARVERFLLAPMANTETVCTPPTLYAKSKYFRAQDNVIKNIRLLLHIIICKADTKCILFTSYGTKTQFHLQHPQHVAVERLYDMGNLPRLCSRSAKKLSVQLINCLLRKLQTNYNDQVQYNTFLF